MRRSLALLVSLSLAAAPAFGQGTAAALTRIGAAAAVHGRVSAQAPGAAVGRVVQSGKPIFLNDHVLTDAAGRLQVMLLDETVFTLGPNSDMVLDEFVYDPKNDAGKVTARVAKGVFRFVTGKVARRDPESMKVKLPVGTIGIRGTIALGQAGPDGSTAILLGPGSHGNTDEAPGAITFESNGTTRMISAPGQGVTCKAGEAPSGVQDLTAVANQLNALLQSPNDSKAQNTGGPGSDTPASKKAAQDTHAARGSSSDAELVTVAEEGQSSALSQAVQDQANHGITDGIASWDQIRGNVTTGTGYYFSGEAPVTGSAGFQSSSPTGSLQLQIDFGARTIGGSGGIFNPTSGQSGSFIHIHGVASSGNTDTIQQTIGVGGSSPISFASLTGPATLTLNGSNLGSATNTAGGTGNFNNTTISLQNAGGVAAANALTNMQFSGTNTLSNPISASGSFVSPKY